MKESNPFEEENIAVQWISSVEGERGLMRDNKIYPSLQKWFEKTSKGVVVDIGSGQGICSLKISGYSRYIGVEPSSFLVARAKELYSSPERDFLEGDAYALPLLGTGCDNAFSINVWFHLENLQKASEELARVLKRGGKFFIHTADGDALDFWKACYINPQIQGKKMIGEVKVPVNNLSVNTFYMYDNAEVFSALEKAGLKILNVTKLGLPEKEKPIFIAIEGEKIL